MTRHATARVEEGVQIVMQSRRRELLRGTMAAGAAAALGDFGFLGTLQAVHGDDARVTPGMVKLCPDIEPLVRMIEATPRERLIEEIVGRIRGGLGYQPLLASLLLAGVRTIHARPVGFEFHCVLVVHSAHLAAMAARGEDRWLPILWALDNFKQSQEVKRKKGAWTMPVLDEGKLPKAALAEDRLRAALDQWDEAATDVAVASMTRAGNAGQLFEIFARYGMRDFRHIGHKAIYVANAFRTLQTIGWRHAEPVLRSVAFAMLEYEGVNPAKADLEPDRPFRENLMRAKSFRSGWQVGKRDAGAVAELLAVLRTGDTKAAGGKAFEMVQRGVDPASIWDAIFLAAGELMMRAPGIIALHSVTTANALHYIFDATALEETRRLAMLQAASFIALFAKTVERRGRHKHDLRIDKLEPTQLTRAAADLLAGGDRVAAAGGALELLRRDPLAAEAIFDQARRLVAAKGADSHDYKYSSAVFEDFHNMTPAWRDRFLASSMFGLRTASDADNSLIKRVRASLA